MSLRFCRYRQNGFRPGAGRGSRPPVCTGLPGRRREAVGDFRHRQTRSGRGAGAPRQCPGYTDAEKQRIATGHLVPQRRGQHGLSADELSFSPAALQLLSAGYSREPGVRLLDDGIDGLCRRAARLRAEGLPLPGEMGPETVSAWLRAPRFRDEGIAARTRRPGVALGLAATREGGDVLLVQAACLPGRRTLRVTGTVGPMTRESANVAMAWVRSHAERFAGAAKFDDSTDVHVHLHEVIVALQPLRGLASSGAQAAANGHISCPQMNGQQTDAACHIREGRPRSADPVRTARDQGRPGPTAAPHRRRGGARVCGAARAGPPQSGGHAG